MAATASNAERIGQFYDTEGMDTDELLSFILQELSMVRDALIGPGSDDAVSAEASALENSEMDSYGQAVLEDVFTYDSISAFADTPTSYVNALRYDCTVSGSDVILLFSPSCIDSLFIDENGRLWNLSTSTIQGRVVDETFNPYAVSGTLVYLTPCLGNNFSTIYNYGSPNYLRRYYWSNDRLTYSDTYTEIVVNDYHYPYFESDLWNYFFAFILLGGVLFLWLSRFRRY